MNPFRIIDMKIWIVILLSFIIPWIVGVNIFLKDRKVILIIAPFSAMLSFILNIPGIDYGFFYPTSINNIKLHTLAILPNLGFFCVLSCFFIYLIRHSSIRPVYIGLIATTIGSLSDLMLIAVGYLTYNNGWTILHSILGFFLAFSIIYLYYLALKKYIVI